MKCPSITCSVTYIIISLFCIVLPVDGAYPLYFRDFKLSSTDSITSLGGVKFPKTVGSPEKFQRLRSLSVCS